MKKAVVGFVDEHRGQFGAGGVAGRRQQAQDAGDLSKSEKETAQLGTPAEEERSWHHPTPEMRMQL